MSAGKANPDSPYMTPPEVARLLRVTCQTVLGWIRAGELRAANVGCGKKRPRYRVARHDVDAFMQSREVATRPSRPRRRKRVEGNWY